MTYLLALELLRLHDHDHNHVSNPDVLKSTLGIADNTSRPTERYFAVCVTAILIPLILVGNVLVIISYKINRRLRTRTNTFLISLAVSDMIVGGVNLPMWVFCMVEYTNCMSSPYYNMVFKFLDRFGAFASIFHLTSISVERYIAVVRPYLFHRLPERFFFGASAFAWIIAMVLASLSWLGNSHTIRYNTAVFAIGFVLPATIVLSMYVGIFRSARALLKRTPSFSGDRNHNANIIREDHKVAVTVAVISGLFIIAWLPFFLLSIIVSYCPHSTVPCLPTTQADIFRLVSAVKWLHYSNSSVNPIVYAFRDEEWKKTFKKIIFRLGKKGDLLRTLGNSVSYASPSANKTHAVVYL